MASTPHLELPISIGHVGLVLLQDENGLAFYLEILLDIIRDLCKKPRKYLVYLGWCVLGCEGKLALEGGGEINDVGDLEEQVTYRYARNAPEEDPGTFLSRMRLLSRADGDAYNQLCSIQQRPPPYGRPGCDQPQESAFCCIDKP